MSKVKIKTSNIENTEMKNYSSIFSRTWVRYIINTTLVVLLFVLMYVGINTGAINRQYGNILIQVGFNIILVVSLNFSAGFLGILPLGHAGFMSVGAYTAGIIIYYLSSYIPDALVIPVCLLAGLVMGAISGLLVAIPTLRLSGDYLAIITLGFGEIIRVILQNMSITKGSQGLNFVSTGYKDLFAITFICVAATIFVIYTIIKSRHGRAIMAIRENEIAAEASGIPTVYYKTVTFTISAMFAGLAGALYSCYMGSITPTDFGFMKSVDILVMTVLGGLGSILGSIVSAFALTVIPEWLREFSSYRMVVYALLLVVIMIFKPSGLMGRYDFSLGRILEKLSVKIRNKGADKAAPDNTSETAESKNDVGGGN